MEENTHSEEFSSEEHKDCPRVFAQTFPDAITSASQQEKRIYEYCKWLNRYKRFNNNIL